MFKVLCCLLIFVSCGSCGFLISANYSSRVACLNDFIESFQFLYNEILYKRDPLPDTFERIGRLKTNSASAFFLKLHEILKENKLFYFRECWEASAAACYGASPLKRSDLETIKDIGGELGKSDMAGQSSLFARTIKSLEECRKDAVCERDTKGKMYRSLGIVIGIVTVILLI